MILNGLLGSKSAIATLTPTTFTLACNNKTVMESLWVACFQRVDYRLKTCDVVWINGQTIHSMTMDRVNLSELREALSPVQTFDMGRDPAPWKRWGALARKEGWQKEDWVHFLTPIEESGSDWQPGSESESESESDEEM